MSRFLSRTRTKAVHLRIVDPKLCWRVGTGVGAQILRTAIGSLGAMFAGMGIFLAVLLFVVVKRSHAAKAQWRASSEQVGY
jgi:hypothetical protein